MYDEAARERFRKASEQYRRLKSSYEIVRGEERVARLHVYQEHVQRIPAAGKLEVVDLCRTCAAALQSGKVPRVSVAGGADLPDPARLALPELRLVERVVLSRVRGYLVILQCQVSGDASHMYMKGHSITFPQRCAADETQTLLQAVRAAAERVSVTFLGRRTLLQRAFLAGRFKTVLQVRADVLVRWLAVLADPSIRPDYVGFVDDSVKARLARFRAGSLAADSVLGDELTREVQRVHDDIFEHAQCSESEEEAAVLRAVLERSTADVAGVRAAGAEPPRTCRPPCCHA